MHSSDIFKKIIFLLTLMLSVIGILIVSVFRISSNENLEEVSNRENFYNLKVDTLRGTIYDCRGTCLINSKKKLIASIIPNKINFAPLLNSVENDKKKEFIKKYFNNVPFTFEILNRVNADGVKVFEVVDQSFDSPIACHIIGYLKNGVGECGIEKAFDDHLKNVKKIEVKYQKNASGEVISGKERDFIDKSYLSSHGVQLCIDKRIQEIAEEVAKKYITRGAVVITEVPNCKIKASVSLPNFTPDKVKYLLNSENSDLMNRANCQYNLGSIFKIVSSAYLIESGISENEIYECKGFLKFDDGKKIRCFNEIPHGNINLEKAVSLSCNSMFAGFSKRMDPIKFLLLVKNFGFGKKINLAPGIYTSSGKLPSVEDLKDEKKMAMFSFGQGVLMASPMQVAALINSIASGGIYYEPRLVEGIVNKDGTFETYHYSLPKKILKFITTKKLKDFMRSSIMFGTGKYGNPEGVSAAGKTSTAETGILVNGYRVNQSWFAGFFPFENPKYSVVILSENTNLGGRICGPIFKEIAERISKLNS